MRFVPVSTLGGGPSPLPKGKGATRLGASWHQGKDPISAYLPLTAHIPSPLKGEDAGGSETHTRHPCFETRQDRA